MTLRDNNQVKDLQWVPDWLVPGAEKRQQARTQHTRGSATRYLEYMELPIPIRYLRGGVKLVSASQTLKNI